MDQNKYHQPGAALQATNLSAPSMRERPDLDAIAAAAMPVDYAMPGELVEQIKRIDQWAQSNHRQAQRERILFWALKIPVIMATAGYGVMIKFGWDTALALSGGLASACVLIEGLYRPGMLRNLHHKAHFDLSNLADDLLTKWHIGVLNGEENRNGLAAKLIDESRIRKDKISAYLVETEAVLGKERMRIKKC
jgi:hypothetical protein